MIAKVQPARKHSSSFKRLQEYLTRERDADTGELLLRGDVVMSENLLGFDTAAMEMQGVASLNNRAEFPECAPIAQGEFDRIEPADIIEPAARRTDGCPSHTTRGCARASRP